MAPTKRLAGIVSMTIDGDTFDVMGNLQWSCSGEQRETATGMSGIPGYTVRPYAGYISATLLDHENSSVADLQDKTDATVTVQLANGKMIYGAGMWFVGQPPEVAGDTGQFSVRFESDDVSEGLAS